MSAPSLHTLFKRLREADPGPTPWGGDIPVAIYGAGGFGRELASTLRSGGIEIICFIDHGANFDQLWEGIRVLKPESVEMADRPMMPVLVGPHNPRVRIASVMADLKSQGFQRVFSPIDVFSHINASFGHRYWLASPKCYLAAEAPIAEARARFAPESHALFDAAQLHFIAGQGEASAVFSEGSLTIQCVAVGGAAPHFRPTLLKLDVEGAELGAQRTIRGRRPSITAGLHHHPSHLWEVPLLLKRLCPRYRKHLRLHAENGFTPWLHAAPDRASA